MTWPLPGRNRRKPARDSMLRKQLHLVVLAALSLGCAAFIAGGCTKKPVPTPATSARPPIKAAKKTTPAEVAKAPQPTAIAKVPEEAVKSADVNSSSAEVASEATNETATADDKVSKESPAVAAPAPPAAGVERFVLLTQQTPLVVEVELRIGGKSHSEALAALVAEVIKAADSDGDGRPTWKELTESKRFIYGQFGNVMINDDNQKKQVVDMYDQNKNGVVDRGEVPRFVTRNAGKSRAFSVRGTADLREIGPRETPLWQLLQGDDDLSSLTPEEMATATGRLRSRDTDDDDVLLPGDLVENLELMPGQMPTRNRRIGPRAIELLGENANWNMIAAYLEEQYALGGRLSPASFAILPKLFEQLDGDGNGRILTREVKNLDHVLAHVRLAVDFDPPQAVGAPADANSDPAAAMAARLPRLRLVFLCPELEAMKRGVFEQPGRLLVQLGNLSLMLYAADQVGGADYEARAKQLLDQFDADKNGYLEAKEIPEQVQGQLARIEAVDTDEDGKVYTGEIVAFLAQQQAALRAQVHAKAGDRDDPLFAALDINGDDRLDGREIDAAADGLKQLDKNANGQIDLDEIPSAMFVGLARGSLENADALFVPPSIASRGPSPDAPRWFSSMDTSRDGLVSRREFLGTAEQFAALDRNEDGFVDAEEARSSTTAEATETEANAATAQVEEKPSSD